MNRGKNNIILVLFMIVSFSLVAQTPEKELDALVKKYNSLNNFSAKIHYFVYKGHNDIKASEEMYGFFDKENNKLRMAQYGTEIIQDGQYVLIKDDSASVIVISRAKKDQNVAFNIDQVLANYSKLEAITPRKATQTAFRVFFKSNINTEYEKAEVYINKTTHLIDEIVLFYAKTYDVSIDPLKTNYQKPKMRMVYTKFDTKPVFSKDTFDVTKYVTINTNGKIIVKTKYSAYEFHDQTQ